MTSLVGTIRDKSFVFASKIDIIDSCKDTIKKPCPKSYSAVFFVCLFVFCCCFFFSIGSEEKAVLFN